ncbi:hypothetical protein NC652_012072 [Populus alba x Populus x berolinensis]|nr:hypothetical protein NC652_012072 [Populus alba x Populus x berolinensis]
MKLQLKVAFACLVGVVWIQQGFCDELSTKSGINNWTCTCSASYQGNQSYTTSNCSTSCDCSPVGVHDNCLLLMYETSYEVGGGKSRGTWTCTCSTDGLPKVAAGSQDTTCFTACNCTSGSLTDVQATRKHISSKIVVILLCVILTTLAFLTSTTWYLCRKDKCPIQSPTFSSDRETSCNSATNLISHRASSVSETKIHVDSPVNPISGCFRKASFLCRSKTEIIHGTLICFAYSELEHATDKFSHSNLIGLGGSSYVYRGQLKDGTTVAVKRLTAQGGTDADLLFSREITDLGMAKRLRADGVPSSSSSPARMQGTFGYFAPEYAMIGRASLMSDVFSFGVVLLEVITGRQPIHKTTNKVEESLVSWATPRFQDSRRVISELPDPRLKGNFPEEELQIMAYLAKECLLMDPDSRPSMSEVVQILSTIAPEKSKRRNIPVSLFQMSSIQSVTTDPYKEKPDSRAEDPVDVDRNLFVGSCIEGADNISTKYMERLIISTSKPHSWGAADDEAVDLTEPRLESFCVENVESA